jgi:hypothetical protein
MSGHHFVGQLGDAQPRLAQRPPSGRGDRVVLAHLSRDGASLAGQVAAGFERVQDWVQRAGAEVIPVPRQLVDEREPVTCSSAAWWRMWIFTNPRKNCRVMVSVVVIGSRY